jgi:hypothetical protein
VCWIEASLLARMVCELVLRELVVIGRE